MMIIMHTHDKIIGTKFGLVALRLPVNDLCFPVI